MEFPKDYDKNGNLKSTSIMKCDAKHVCTTSTKKL